MHNRGDCAHGLAFRASTTVARAKFPFTRAAIRAIPADMLLYRILRQVLRLPVSVFFRQVEVIGRENIADDGVRALMLAGNHPNSLLDPLLIVTTSPRPIRFAAKDVLFRTLPMRLILRGLGAVPVKRPADHGQVDNADTFQALSQALAGGGAIGIFPEGLSHDNAQLQRLKTGAARIALDVAHRWDQPLDVVPVGLTYLTPKRFRGRVLVQYGAPIEVGDDWHQRFLQDERAAVRDLTQRMDDELRQLTVNAEDWSTARVLDEVRRLYQPKDIALWQRVELARRFNAAYPGLRDRADVQEVVARVQAYLSDLEQLELTDRDIERPLTLLQVTAKCALKLLDVLVWMPLALPGVILQGPVAALIRAAGERLSPRKDVIATTKLVMGLLLVPLMHLALIALLWWHFGWQLALALAILLPVSGYAALRTLETGFRVVETLRTARRMASLRDEVKHLRSRRELLQNAVERLVDRYRPGDMELLFPRPSPQPEVK